MNDLILYTTEDGRSQIKLRAQEQTVWLTQLEMAELFDATKQNLSLHLKNVFEDGELSEDSVVKESLTTAADGKAYSTKLYNLDAILAVGSISHDQMEARTGELYLKFNQRRKRQEAIQADQQDEADLKALETKIKRRPKK